MIRFTLTTISFILSSSNHGIFLTTKLRNPVIQKSWNFHDNKIFQFLDPRAVASTRVKKNRHHLCASTTLLLSSKYTRLVWVSCHTSFEMVNVIHTTFQTLRLVIYTIEFASEFCVEFACRILPSKATYKLSESRRNLEIESEFQSKFDSRWPTLLWWRWLSSTKYHWMARVSP